MFSGRLGRTSAARKQTGALDRGGAIVISLVRRAYGEARFAAWEDTPRMQLPKEGTHCSNVTRFSRYAARRLRRAGKTGLAKDILTACATVRERGREWEDLEDGVQDALADRDGADDDLDTIAQGARNTLAGRSVTAAKEEPYSLIFHAGIGYYTASPLEEEESRYEELSERITKHLPANDAVRKTAPAAIKKGIAGFKAASADLDKAERARGIARTDLDRAIRNALRQLEKVYGAILSEEGKAAAEAYFPKSSRASAKTKEEKAPAPPEPSPED